MPKNVQVRSVKAADPGLGFLLEISGEPTAATLKVNLTIHDGSAPLTSTLVVHNPSADRIVSVIMPFGDSFFRFNVGSSINYEIGVECPIGTIAGSRSGVVVKSYGHLYSLALFNRVQPCGDPNIEKEKVLWVGQMLASDNGGHIGILQNDGRFCIFPTSFDSIGDLPLSYPSSPVANGVFVSGAGLFVSTDGRIYIKNLLSSPQTLICCSNEAVPGATMHIENGAVVLKAVDGQLTAVTWTTNLDC